MRLSKLIFLCVLFIGCRQNRSETSKYQEVQEAQEVLISQFIVDLEVVVENDDVFELFYQDFDNNKYTWKTKIEKKVKGSDKQQIIRFKIPETIFPKSLRFDFGDNPKTNVVTFLSVKMSYEDFNLKLNSNEFGSFFVPNDYISFDKANGEIRTHEISGKYDPYFDSKPVFKQKLKIETR